MSPLPILRNFIISLDILTEKITNQRGFRHPGFWRICMYVCMYVKLYLKTLAPSTVRWFPRGASTMLKITKDIKGKEDYLQIGVTPDVMVRRCYNLFQIYIVLELSFKWLLNRCIDSASFVSIERLFHSLAPLYLKLFFRNSLLGLGRAKSV